MHLLAEIWEDFSQPPGVFFTRLCEILRQKSRCLLVWLGFVSEDEEIRPRAFSGKHFAYIRNLRIDLRDPELSRGPTARAVLEKRPVVEPDIPSSPSYAPWREKALSFGFRSSLALPLICEQEVFGTLNFYASKENFFTPEMVAQLDHLAREAALILKLYEIYEHLRGENQSLRNKLQRLEDLLQEKELQIRHAEEARDRWLALMGHELRTPLTSILGFSEMLSSGIHGLLNEKQLRYLNHIQKSARFILQLTEALQKVVRFKYLEGSTPQSFRVEQVVEGAVFLLQQKIKERRVRIEIQGKKSLSWKGNQHLLQEIIFNLLSNALKFGPEGGTIWVRIGEETDLHAQRWLSLEVADQGPGISPQDYGRIFKPFVQGGDLYTQKPEGLGLGLSLAREMAETQGGLLLALPSSGGARFLCLFPERNYHLKPLAEVLLLESRPEVVYRLALLLAGERFRSLAFPEKESLIAHFREDASCKIPAFDPWENPRETRHLLLALNEEGFLGPVLLYHARGDRLHLILGANFLCLRPLNFDYLRRIQTVYLKHFDTLPSRVFLRARPHISGEATRLLQALNVEITPDPARAEILSMDLGLPGKEIKEIMDRSGHLKPLFINFSDSALKPPEGLNPLPPRDILRELNRLSLGLKTKIGGAGSLA